MEIDQAGREDVITQEAIKIAGVHLGKKASDSMRLALGEGILGFREDLPLLGKLFLVDSHRKRRFKDEEGKKVKVETVIVRVLDAKNEVDSTKAHDYSIIVAPGKPAIILDEGTTPYNRG